MSRVILALETSTAFGSVAVVRDGDSAPLFVESFASQRSHNAEIFGPLERALAAATSVDLLVVGTGPGSYTGVRIGIAAAIGLSLARGIPLIGIASACAADIPGGAPSRYTVLGDARRGGFHETVVSDHRLVEGPRLVAAEALAAILLGADGDGDGSELFTFDDAPLPDGERVTRIKPHAERLARAAMLLSEDECVRLAQKPVEPVYLAAPFVTTPKKFGK